MKILLDTHIFLWAITDDPRLEPAHREFFESDTSELFLSLASVWEMTIKASLGRLPLPRPVASYIARQAEKNRISLLPVRVPHLVELEQLPPVHRDPFDRMLAAQARSEKLAVLSVDPVMREYGLDLL